ncbi:MAG TPA: YaiI/YqxD family protein [Gammaproteobacteria bacterium]|nr:YaiI/YqxD family protein [Gammaproteobacteria bacterium]
MAEPAAAKLQIWVDADACPKVIKDILFRAAERVKVPMTLVANQPLRTPPSRFIKSVQVGAGFDVADNYIVQQLNAGDLVITADIPLAAEVIEKGGQAINPRGELYTTENIRQRLTMRDFMDQMRASGVDTGGPPSFNHGDRQAFANQLDRLLTASGSGK